MWISSGLLLVQMLFLIYVVALFWVDTNLIWAIANVSVAFVLLGLRVAIHRATMLNQQLGN